MDYHSDPRCVLSVMSNSREPANIRGIFSGAGEIFYRAQLFPYDSGIPGQRHYFVEYQHQKGAERALRLRLGLTQGLHVCPIDGLFVEQYRSCKAHGSSHQPSTTRICQDLTRPYPRADHHNIPVPQDGVHEKRRTYEYSHKLNALGLPRSNQNDCLNGHNPSWTPGSNLTSDSAHTSVDSSIGATTDPSWVPSPPCSLETRIVFEIQGAKQVYDLAQDPGLDPESIIEPLKLSKSERGNWMTTGAYFRRKGNPHAALQVVTTMVQVMYNHGYTLDSLKAAFPLLAACELDLARLARNTCDEKGYDDHFGNAKSWLRMVFGEDPPTLKSALQNVLLQQSAPQPIGISLYPSPPTQGVEGRSSKKYDPMSRASRKHKVSGSSSGGSPFFRNHDSPGRKGTHIGRRYGPTRDYRRVS